MIIDESQSPQTGQFNSYVSNVEDFSEPVHPGLNPLKRVNSILTLPFAFFFILAFSRSQSPQTGQFNSYRWDYLENH